MARKAPAKLTIMPGMAADALWDDFVTTYPEREKLLPFAGVGS